MNGVVSVKMSQNLADVNKEEFVSFLTSFDHVLCDCDGVIFLLHKPIEGATIALEKLEKMGKSIAYVTNNSSAKLDALVKRLCSFGANASVDNVVFPPSAIISYLRSIKFNKKIYLIGFNAMRAEFLDAGFHLADYEPAGDVPLTPEALLKFLQDDLEVGAVVLDLDMNMNYLRLQKAVVYAKRADVLLIMGATDSEIPVGKDLSVMGPSHFNKALECMVGRESMRFGKPGKYLNAYVADLFKLDPRRTLFIGDGFTDMAFANEGGYQKLMVLSGITKLEDIEKCSKPDLLPDYYLNSLVDLAKLIEDLD